MQQQLALEHEQSAQQAQTSSPEAFRRASEYPPHLVAALLDVFCRMGFHPGDMLLRLLLLQLQRSEPGDIPVATALQLLQSLAVLQHDEGAYRLSALQQRSPCFAGSSTACCMALDVAVLQHRQAGMLLRSVVQYHLCLQVIQRRPCFMLSWRPLIPCLSRSCRSPWSACRPFVSSRPDCFNTNRLSLRVATCHLLI